MVNTPAHQQLAKEAADQSLVLLKNNKRKKKKQGNTLPLDLSLISSDRKIAVVGRNAMATNNMQGNYFGPAPYLISPCAGIAAGVGVDRKATICDDGADNGARIVQEIKSNQVAVVVLVVGLVSEAAPKPEQPDEAEGHDRVSLTLPYGQDALIASVCAAAAHEKIPCVLLTMNGGKYNVAACILTACWIVSLFLRGGGAFLLPWR